MNGNRRFSGSDWDKDKAEPVTSEQYEEIPELTDEWFAKAELHVGGEKVRGRPKSPTRKVALKLRIDPDVIKAFRATGPGWQTRINETLRQAVRLSRKRQAIKAREHHMMKKAAAKRA
jgi:uncharacterized protein (DUF4415 family)